MEPLRADHRFIRQIMKLTIPGKVEHRPQEFAMISRFFRRYGGSWERVFKGSPRDIDLLKRVVKAALKRGLLTKKEKWEADA